MTIVCSCCNGVLPWHYYTAAESGEWVEFRCFCGHIERRKP